MRSARLGSARPLYYGLDMSRREAAEADEADRLLVNMKVPEKELMSDILKRLTGDSALPIYSNVEKFKRGKEGTYAIAEDIKETVKKREMVNAKERLRVGVISLSFFIFLYNLLFWSNIVFGSVGLSLFGFLTNRKRRASMIAALRKKWANLIYCRLNSMLMALTANLTFETPTGNI